MFLIKLGGSVVTNKERKCTFLEKRTRRLVEEMRYIEGPMLITHGGGSFGHDKASYFRLKEGLQEELQGSDIDQVQGFCEVQEDMRNLNQLILGLMNRAGMKVVSVPTCSVVTYSNFKISKIDFKVFDRIIDLGARPMAFGDVVFDNKTVFTICSADALMVELAKRYRPDKAVFVTDVDGLFEENPDDHPNASLITEVRSTKDVPKGLRTSGKRKGVKDVTGGMVSKTIASLKMARMGVETWMVNGAVDDRVGRLLKGYDVVGTRFVPKGPNKGGKGGPKE